MGKKVREWVGFWSRVLGTVNTEHVRGPLKVALDADDADHAAELEKKDRRIAELEVERDASRGMTRVHAQDVAVLEARIAELESEELLTLEHYRSRANSAERRILELEAELAKRELPPLPESVRRVVDEMREQLGFAVTDIKAYRARDLVDWLDRHYPAPVPQWEQDARRLESFHLMTDKERIDIAARIREAHRDQK